VTSLIVRPEAESDIYEAYAYYEIRSAGLGEIFLDSIESALQAIRDDPRRFPEVLHDPQEPVRWDEEPWAQTRAGNTDGGGAILASQLRRRSGRSNE
jgi:hypothetical protein